MSDESKLIEMNLSFFEKSKDMFSRFTETHIQRAHSETEITNALKKAGFGEIYVYDCFGFEKPAVNSERLQFIALK